MVAKKDFNLPKHPDVDTKNLFVVKACQSLNSRGYVKTQFSWQYYYYTLTNEGLEYLRNWCVMQSVLRNAVNLKLRTPGSTCQPRSSLQHTRRPFVHRNPAELTGRLEEKVTVVGERTRRVVVVISSHGMLVWAGVSHGISGIGCMSSPCLSRLRYHECITILALVEGHTFVERP